MTVSAPSGLSLFLMMMLPLIAAPLSDSVFIYNIVYFTGDISGFTFPVKGSSCFPDENSSH